MSLSVIAICMSVFPPSYALSHDARNMHVPDADTLVVAVARIFYLQIVHGEEAADIAKKTAEDLFENAGRSEDMKTTEITNDELGAGMQIADALVKAGLMKSKGEARRMIQQKGVYLNDAVVEDQFYELKESDFDGNGEAIVRKGKKNYHRFKLA